MARWRKDRPDRLSAVGSVTIHGVALVLAWYSTTSRPQPFQFPTYQIDLVSPPPTVQAEEKAPAEKKLVVEHPDRPEPEPEKKETTPPITEPKKKKVEPEKPKAAPTPPKEAEKSKKATTTEKTTDKKTESGDDIRVRMEGLQRDYPQYYNDIIRQMYRCFRWQGQGNWSTIIQFVIRRDGSVTDIKVAQPSGNPVFDIQAMGAAECAGEGRLDSLPKELPYDRLPVRFKINPSGGDD